MLKRRKPGASAPTPAGLGPRFDYAEVRAAVLEADAAGLGLAPSTELPNVFGLIMDTSYETGTATVVVLAEGTTSLYTSTGAGLIGAGAHEAVAAASTQLLHAAESSLEAFAPGSGEVPPPGSVALVALTHDGLRRAEAPEGEFAAGHHAASPVYETAQQVVAALRGAT